MAIDTTELERLLRGINPRSAELDAYIAELVRVINISDTPVFVTGMDTTTQTFSATNTEQPVDVNTIIGFNGINSLGNGVFQITETGKYDLHMFPILTKSIGVSISHFLWVQLDTGSGFADIADSNSETILVSGETNDVKTITFQSIFILNAGDKIRFMNSVTNTNLTLITKTPPAGNGPRIPSVIMSINKL